MKELKNGRSGLMSCDGELLKNVIKVNGYTPKQLAELMNYNSGYFTRCIRNNSIGKNAVEKLKEYKIMPAQYRAESMESLQKKVQRLKEEKEIAVAGGLEESERRFNEKLNAFEVNNKKYDGEIMKEIEKKNSGRYPWGESEKSPVEKAMEEPGVVKLEFTIDIIKLKAIVKQAVKEAYDEI